MEKIKFPCILDLVKYAAMYLNTQINDVPMINMETGLQCRPVLLSSQVRAPDLWNLPTTETLANPILKPIHRRANDLSPEIHPEN